MRLKKIVLCGFKSFADKTELEFGEGITVVVGPNGCGKSNIVDAVKWVLGEQSAKSLRGGQMLDVIFNGTSSRKSMSMAEVMLVFDNTGGLINVDQGEVTVTRRLYRSGESEYLLNKKVCRLKDIREMFMDTGIGNDAYSIIEQGKVETLLQASKQDRRAIFEEAAGISKYKARKKEALRKLERTRQNLMRLNDIIAELEKRLRSIKYQAGKARNYQNYAARLNELQLSQFLARYYQLQSELKSLQRELASKEDELAGINSQTGQIQNQLSKLDHEIDTCNTELRQVENELLQCTSQIGSQEDRMELARRRCAEMKQLVIQNTQRMQALKNQTDQIETEIKDARQELEQLQLVVKEQQGQLKELQDKRQQQELGLNELRANLEDEKSGLIDIVRRTAQLHNEINTMDMRRNSLTGQKERLNNRNGIINTELKEKLSHRAELHSRQEKINTLLRESKEQLEAQREALSQLSSQRLECSENLSAAKENRRGLISRRQLLVDLEEKFAGVDQGVRQILQQKKQNPESYMYIRAMVAELLQADVKYASLIEAALADKAQYLVSQNSVSLLEDKQRFENLKGRVRIICMDRLPAYSDGFDFSSYPQVKARMVELINYAPEYEPLAWYLLGKTMLVDDIESAMQMADIAPAGYRWVTMNGELLEADGTLHAGPHKNSAGLISRKSELRELDMRLQEATQRITDLQNQSEQYTNQAQHLEKNLQNLRTAIYETNTEAVETRSQLEQLEQEINRLKQEQPLIAGEIENLEKQIEESIRIKEASQKDLEQLEGNNKKRQEQIDLLENKIAILQSEHQKIVNEITNIKVSLGGNQQKILGYRNTINSLQSRLQQHGHDTQMLQNDIVQAQQRHDESQRTILKSESIISELFMLRQEKQAAVRNLRIQHEQLLASKEQLAEQLREYNRNREELQQQLHELQMDLNEKTLRGENLIDRAREELKLDLLEHFANYEHQQIDSESVTREVEDLRNKINRLGNVNLDAINEQEELEKRLEYLTGQYKDLEKSGDQLERLISKINHESETLFRSNFETIQANFSAMFRKLFGGGRAEIMLEDPDNILECGIEIIARPPGKQLQSISLLSGGEKTMAAVALLLAIFKSKPSPFCLLDEVDAALDEANNERLNLVIQDFLSDSQFIIITHSRRTMALADNIYGITMQEHGVSKKVSVHFTNHDDTDDSAVA